MATITAANAAITLVIDGVFGSGQQLQGFAADDIFSTEQISPTDTIMGVDGFLSGGRVPNPIAWSISLQADSPSQFVFDNWYQTQQLIGETVIASGIVTLPAISMSYSLVKGFLTRYSPITDARRVLQPRRFTITWESVFGIPL